MAAATPTIEPTSLTAGDTISFTKSLADYPASEGWTLTYAFRKEDGGGAADVTATTSSEDYAVTVAAAVTEKWQPGMWFYQAYVTSGTQRYQVAEGRLTVKRNLARLDHTADLRSAAKRAYDNALTAWESVKLGQSVTLNGRTYTQLNITELIKYVDRCKSEYQSELKAERIAAGLGGKRILVRMGTVG